MKNDPRRFESEEDQAPRKKKKFNLFDFLYQRNEKRQSRIVYDPKHKRDFPYFFRMMFDHFRTLFSLNLLMVVSSFPIFILMLVFSENLHLHASAPSSPLAAPLLGALRLGAGTPAALSMYGLYGVSTDVAVWTPIAYILLAAGLVLMAAVFGPVNTGAAYVLRNIVRGEPPFLWNDYTHAIRSNLRQEFTVGVLDFALTALIAYDIYFFYLNIHGTLTGMFFYASLVIALLYFIMRFYIYTMMVTFDLSVPKLYKNALIFTILNWKRNLVAVLGIAAAVVLNVAVAIVYLPLGIIIPFLITVSLCMFIGIYAAWPKIKEMMIDPYYDEDGKPLQNAGKASR